MIQVKRAHVKSDSLRQNWWKLGLLSLGGYLVWILARGMIDINQAYHRIDEARVTLAIEQTKAEKLKAKWEEIQTRDYLERVARNDLNMQKEGETIVVIPITQKLDTGETQEQEVVEDSNWKKWWKLVR